MPGPSAQAITVSPKQSAELNKIVRRHKSPQYLVSRAKVILLAANDCDNQTIADKSALQFEAGVNDGLNTVQL